MRIQRRLAFIAAALCACCAASCGRSNKDAAITNPWAQFQPGSWVVLKTVTTSTIQGKETSKVHEAKWTLVEVTPENIVLEQERTGDGAVIKETVTAPLKEAPPPKGARAKVPAGVSLPTLPDLETPVSQGEETLVIGDQTVQAKWVEYGGGAALKKEWRSAEVPGPFCKLLLRMGSDEARTEIITEVVAFEKK